MSPLPVAPTGLRQRLRVSGTLDGLWHLAVELAVLAGHHLGRTQVVYERRFRAAVDPWDYAGALGRARHAAALGLLDGAACGRVPPFGQAVELGCAEGAFTAALAARCRHVIGVDFSPTALGRARRRCAGVAGVSFRQLDLKRGGALRSLGQFDLVVAMDVLEEGFGPLALRALRARIVNLVVPGGVLLVGNSRQSRVFEASRWGRWLIRGGRHINAFIGAHPDLRTHREHLADEYVLTLYRRAG